MASNVILIDAGNHGNRHELWPRGDKVTLSKRQIEKRQEVRMMRQQLGNGWGPSATRGKVNISGMRFAQGKARTLASQDRTT